jgi:hypothetical protein
MNSDLTDTSDRSHESRGPSQLFLLRVWLDESSEHDWHGRVQHAVTGEAHYFRTCAELRRIIRGMMAPEKSDPFLEDQCTQYPDHDKRSSA